MAHGCGTVSGSLGVRPASLGISPVVSSTSHLTASSAGRCVVRKVAKMASGRRSQGWRGGPFILEGGTPDHLDVLDNPQAYHPGQVCYAAWSILNRDLSYFNVSPWYLREKARQAQTMLAAMKGGR